MHTNCPVLFQHRCQVICYLLNLISLLYWFLPTLSCYHRNLSKLQLDMRRIYWCQLMVIHGKTHNSRCKARTYDLCTQMYPYDKEFRLGLDSQVATQQLRLIKHFRRGEGIGLNLGDSCWATVNPKSFTPDMSNHYMLTTLNIYWNSLKLYYIYSG